jgi:hypothetical protein
VLRRPIEITAFIGRNAAFKMLLACVLLSAAMPPYNWPRVGWRLALAAAMSLMIVISVHTSGKSAWPPPSTCQGGIVEALVFEAKFVAALLFVEGLHWLAWFMRQGPRPSGKGAVVTGGKLFAPRDVVASIALGLFLLKASTYIGVATPCDALPFRGITLRMAIGEILAAYAILLFANIPWRYKKNRYSDTGTDQ